MRTIEKLHMEKLQINSDREPIFEGVVVGYNEVCQITGRPGLSVDVNSRLTASNNHFSLSTQSHQSTASSKDATNCIKSTTDDATNCVKKKNILQRRGSNTSLTLNIVGSTDASSNSLNSLKLPSSADPSNNATAKKSLLGRRNPNRNLTLQLESRPVARGSSFESQMEDRQACTTCGEGSKSKFAAKAKFVFNSDQSSSETEDGCDEDTAYCPCSISLIRNITTRPLSPQTTCVEFKSYMANIEKLRNASNVLTVHKLTALSNAFNRSYSTLANGTMTNRSLNNCTLSNRTVSQCDSCETCSICKTCEMCETKCSCELNRLLAELHKEFWDLPTNYQPKSLVSGSQVKNRYKSILPNEHSRVHLEGKAVSQKQFENANDSYINANYIKGPNNTEDAYIATQGPMNSTIYDFWLMVFQNYRKAHLSGRNVNTIQQKIVMLTNMVENDKSKCAQYFPQALQEVSCFPSNLERNQPDIQQIYAHFANHTSAFEPNEIRTIDENWTNSPAMEFFSIKTVNCVLKNGYAIRKFHCMYHTCERSDSGHSRDSEALEDQIKRKIHCFVVYHYWFPHWPDQRSPENVDVVLDMCINILDSDCEQQLSNQILSTNESHRQKTNKPSNDAMPIIHCSAGIGRTGCVAGILNGLRQLSQPSENSNAEPSVDVLGIVSNLRLQRGGMVQNSEQYELIHRALCLFLQRTSK